MAITGVLLARFRPFGMARAMFGAALIQVLVAAVALIAGWGDDGPAWPSDIIMLTVFFTSLWLISGFLFRKAAQAGSPAAEQPQG